jgi:hypothetical protein
MSLPLPFFSTEWCNEARILVNTSAEVQAGFKDPTTFDLTLIFVCESPEYIQTWALFKQGMVDRWAPGAPPVGARAASLRAKQPDWRTAAEGNLSASTLLVERRMRLRDSRNQIAHNYAALDAVVATWRHIPTLWDS